MLIIKCKPILSIVLVLGVQLQSIFVVTFTTNKCNHHEVENGLKDALNCSVRILNKNLEYVLLMNETQIFASDDLPLYKFLECDTLYELRSCLSDNLGTCLNEISLGELLTLFELYYNKQANVTCRKIKSKYSEKQTSSVVQEYQDNKSVLNPLMRSDVNCSIEYQIPSSNVSLNCFFEDLLPLMENLLTYLFGSYPRQPISALPVCKKLFNMLKMCINTADCLSQPEKDLIGNAVATYYRIAMTYAIQLSNRFSEFSNDTKNSENGKNILRKPQPKLNLRETIQETQAIIDDFQVMLINVHHVNYVDFC